MGKAFRSMGLAPIAGIILLVVLLVRLGFWQLDRADQKRKYLAQQQQLIAGNALLLNKDTGDQFDSLTFSPVVVAGEYDNEHQFLLDNQHVFGKVGYFVLTPLLLGDNKAVLVNRGWVPANLNRKILPAIMLKNKNVSLRGRINRFPGVGFKLAGAEIPSPQWPSIVQVVNIKELEKVLQTQLFGFQIELDATEIEGYVRQWNTPVTITPDKHIAYAVQWFGLAVTLVVLFIWTMYKKQ